MERLAVKSQSLHCSGSRSLNQYIVLRDKRQELSPTGFRGKIQYGGMLSAVGIGKGQTFFRIDCSTSKGPHISGALTAGWLYFQNFRAKRSKHLPAICGT